MTTICILGRQPEIGLAELESLYGSSRVRPIENICALVDGDVDFTRLGGSIKTATLLATVESDLRGSFKKIASLLPALSRELSGKIKLGLSLYGYTMPSYDLNGEGLRLKKVLKHLGHSVRVVPNETPALSSAQTYHNQLAGDLGLEFVIVRDGPKTLIGRINAVQNIDNYRIRDRERPKRDAFVGMLPPKLAQIIVNLAVGEIERGESQKTPSTLSDLQSTICVLDPFCGTGVILQEALLMGYNAYGTDISPKMIDYTKANLKWLGSRVTSHESRVKVDQADATTYGWDFSKIQDPRSKICVASETYLGQPLGGQQPTKEKFAEIVQATNAVIRDFLSNIGRQLPVGSRLCLAVPAWYIDGTYTRLSLVDELESLGYSRVEFAHAVTPIIYRRDDQVTGRELLVLTNGTDL